MTEKSINERIQELIDALKLSNNAFAKSIGRPSATIQQIVSGRSKPGFEILEAICEKYTRVNTAWLLKGDGEMFSTESLERIIADSPDKYLQDTIKHLEESFTRLAGQFELTVRQLETKDIQIQSLSEMLKMTLGKYKDVAQFETARTKRMWPEIEPALQA